MCSICGKDMDIYGNHALHCANAVVPKYRHDLVCDIISDMCYKAGVVARKEISLGFLSSDSAGEAKHADILVYNREDGKDVFFDVTVVSPFTSARTRNYTPGHAISSAVSCKRNKYLDKCSAHGYGFNALAFTTLGELGEDTIIFMNKMRNCLIHHDANYKVGSSLFHRLGITIQKGVGAQLVARLPSTDVY